MAEEIATFVAKQLRQTFPKGVKKPTTVSQAGSVGGLGDTLKNNDPETLRFIAKHTTSTRDPDEDNGANIVKTKYSLDDPKNVRLKGHGKDKEKGVYENTEEVQEATVCKKCHKFPCACSNSTSDKSKDEPAYGKDKALLLGGKKLRESTLANQIAMEILEGRKIVRLEEEDKSFVGPTNSWADKLRGKKNVQPTTTAAPAPSAGSGNWSDKFRKTKVESEGGLANKNSTQPPVTTTKSVKLEAVKLSNQQDTENDTKFTKGMGTDKTAEGEMQTLCKPEGPASEKSKQLDKREIKKPVTRTFKEGSQSEPQLNQIDETLSKNASSSDYVDDFVHSSNEKFKGKSKAKRINMALGAYYAKKRSHNEGYDGGQANAAEPMLEGGKKKKQKLKEGGAPSDTPMNYGSVPNTTMNTKADTGMQLEGGKKLKRNLGTEKRLNSAKRLDVNVSTRSKRQNQFDAIDEEK